MVYYLVHPIVNILCFCLVLLPIYACPLWQIFRPVGSGWSILMIRFFFQFYKANIFVLCFEACFAIANYYRLYFVNCVYKCGFSLFVKGNCRCSHHVVLCFHSHIILSSWYWLMFIRWWYVLSNINVLGLSFGPFPVILPLHSYYIFGWSSNSFIFHFSIWFIKLFFRVLFPGFLCWFLFPSSRRFLSFSVRSNFHWIQSVYFLSC